MKEAFLCLNKKEKYIIGGLGLAGLVLNPWSVPVYLICLWSWLKYPKVKWYYYLLPVLCLVILSMVVLVATDMLTPVQAITTPGIYMASYFAWIYNTSDLIKSISDLGISKNAISIRVFYSYFFDPINIPMHLHMAIQGMLTYWALTVLFINHMREKGGYRWWVSGN